MYGLLHAGLLAQQFLEQQLESQGYSQSSFTPVFWKQNWIPITFTLLVKNFRVKYIGKQHAKKVIEVLKEHC